MSAPRPYIRSMDGWWKRDPFFVGYMAREATALLVAAYAIVLLVGLVRLGQGETAYAAWLRALTSPFALTFHCIVLATFIYHTWSWFRIMPKTMPGIWIGGARLQPGIITWTGILVAVIASEATVLLSIWSQT